MTRGRVIGEVWATRRHPRMAGRKWLLVAEVRATDQGEAFTGRVVVAADALDAGPGDPVVVAFGSGARNALEARSRDVLADAAIVQILDGTSSPGGRFS
ncbi:MAG TPA: EutN/CcmL family microcompartment protein [Myxococcota bacterium]|nr:EutN/CcmL family microcompartment protein [Myxococcota bacterium]HQK50567.1 EutN/CcmL family microcompartment protein [Myxococcota bacterium]